VEFWKDGAVVSWASVIAGNFLYSLVETYTMVFVSFVSCEFVIVQEVMNKIAWSYSGFKLCIFLIFVYVQFICHYNLLICLPVWVGLAASSTISSLKTCPKKETSWKNIWFLLAHLVRDVTRGAVEPTGIDHLLGETRICSRISCKLIVCMYYISVFMYGIINLC